jgi:formiminotetrahydrofolate cyclodeaminase
VLYRKGSIERYLADLGGPAPAPGGGSAAALAAATAASLVAMACRFTIGRDRYKAFGPRAEKILAQSLKRRKRLGVLLDADAQAYGRKDWEAALRVPAQVCLEAAGILADAWLLIEKGNKNLVSDAMLAALLARVSFESAFSYVLINARSLKKLSAGQAALVRRARAARGPVKRLAEKVEVCLGDFAGR